MTVYLLDTSGGFHMNEGHASLLPRALLDERARKAGRCSFTHEDIEEVRGQCVLTTHTPVPAGHDQFSTDLLSHVLGRPEVARMHNDDRWDEH